MKKQIRIGTFETNSSSVHAISIFTNNDFSKVEDKRSLTIEAGCFGWECEIYNDEYSKLSYLYTAYLDLVGWKLDTSWDWFIPTVKELCEKHNLNIEFKEPTKSDWYYVDHPENLVDLFNEFKENNFLLESFIFNTSSEIATGNDNSEDAYLSPKDGADYSFIKYN